jgi:hypothetical protein
MHNAFRQFLLIDSHVQHQVFKDRKTVAKPYQQVVALLAQLVTLTKKLNQLEFSDAPSVADLRLKHFPDYADC